MFGNRFTIWVLGCWVALIPLACSDDAESDNENKDTPRGTDTTVIRDTDTGTALAESTDTDMGSDGVDEAGAENASDTAKDVITARMMVPPEFDGVPGLLGTMFFAADSEGGMPDAFGDSFTNPEVVAGEAYPFTTTQAGLEGDYYLAIVLYCEGGGNGQFPVAGVDWLGETETAITLGPGTGTIDVGEIPLFLAD